MDSIGGICMDNTGGVGLDRICLYVWQRLRWSGWEMAKILSSR